MSDATSDKLLFEALRLAEQNLESETKLMTAADQRSTGFCGILMAALAVVAGLYDGDTAAWNDDLSLILIGMAAGFAAYSARSVKIYSPGLPFDNFSQDIKSRRNAKAVFSELARIYDECSTHNRRILKENGRFFNVSLTLALVGFSFSLLPNMISLFQEAARVLRFIGGGDL